MSLVNQHRIPSIFQMKQAAPYTLGSSPEQQRLDKVINAQALRNLSRIGLGLLAIGGGTAAAIGIKNRLFDEDKPENEIDLSPQEIDVRLPEEKKKRRKLAMERDWADALTGVEDDKVIPIASQSDSLSKTLPKVPSMLSKWWYAPAAVATGAAALYGGSKLISWINQKLRNKEQEHDLRTAEEDFDEEIQKLYKEKNAGLAQCWNALEKSAVLGIDLPEASNVISGATGGYLTLAGILAGISGLAAYQMTRDRSKDKLIRHALKRRAQIRSMQNPPNMQITSNLTDDISET